MTQIKSELLLASINAATGDILYTFKWVYPRFILSEVNTHRMLSRNTSSSRAIPSRVQRKRVHDDPVVPISFGANQKGMQAGEEITGFKRWLAERVWTWARIPALFSAWSLETLGVHKQITNRIIEPWTWTTQLVTATDLDNLFKLRCHEAAEPHFQELAKQAKRQVEQVIQCYSLMQCSGASLVSNYIQEGYFNRIQILKPGEWHLPFVTMNHLIDGEHYDIMPARDLKRVSAARCARVSYNMPDTNKPSSVDDDLRLARRLLKDGHMSPFEHQATPMGLSEYSGNFKGWRQHRKDIETGVAYYE